MIEPCNITYANQNEFVIARSDSVDDGYGAEGYVAVVDGHRAAISRYSHCSCFDTFGDDGSVQSWDWEGNVTQLIRMAKKQLDPSMPERKIVPEDYGYGDLIDCYKQILEWDKARRKKAE